MSEKHPRSFATVAGGSSRSAAQSNTLLRSTAVELRSLNVASLRRLAAVRPAATFHSVIVSDFIKTWVRPTSYSDNIGQQLVNPLMSTLKPQNSNAVIVTPAVDERAHLVQRGGAWEIPGLFVPLHFRSRERKVHRENFRSRGTFVPRERTFQELSFLLNCLIMRTNIPRTFPPNVLKHDLLTLQ